MKHGSWIALIVLVMMFPPIVGMAEQPQQPQAKEDPVQIAYNEAAKDLGARLFHLTATIKLLESQLKGAMEENQRLKEAAKKEKPSNAVEVKPESQIGEKK